MQILEMSDLFTCHYNFKPKITKFPIFWFKIEKIEIENIKLVNIKEIILLQTLSDTLKKLKQNTTLHNHKLNQQFIHSYYYTISLCCF